MTPVWTRRGERKKDRTWFISFLKVPFTCVLHVVHVVHIFLPYFLYLFIFFFLRAQGGWKWRGWSSPGVGALSSWETCVGGGLKEKPHEYVELWNEEEEPLFLLSFFSTSCYLPGGFSVAKRSGQTSLSLCVLAGLIHQHRITVFAIMRNPSLTMFSKVFSSFRHQIRKPFQCISLFLNKKSFLARKKKIKKKKWKYIFFL